MNTETAAAWELLQEESFTCGASMADLRMLLDGCESDPGVVRANYVYWLNLDPLARAEDIEALDSVDWDWIAEQVITLRCQVCGEPFRMDDNGVSWNMPPTEGVHDRCLA